MIDFAASFFAYTPYLFEWMAVMAFTLVGHTLSPAERMVGTILFFSLFIDLMADAHVHFTPFLPYYSQAQNNQWIFNVLLPPMYLLTALLYYRILEQRNIRTAIVMICIVFVISHLINILWFQGLDTFATFTLIPPQAGIGLLAFLYLRQVVNSLSVFPFRDFLFWFSIAGLVNYCCTIPIMATLNWFPYSNEEISDKLWSINTWLGYYVYYSIIMTGLLWTRRFQMSSSS